MPMVVSTATQAQANSTTLTKRSTWLRARKAADSERRPNAMPSSPKTRPVPRIRWSVNERSDA